MKVIFLIGSIHALFFSILVFNKKGKTISDKILGSWLLLFSVELVFPFLYYGENYKKFIHLGGIDTPLVVLHATFLYLYAKALISKENKFQKKWLWHLLPFMGFIICMIPYYLTSAKVKIAIYENRMEIPGYLYIYPAIMAISLSAYIFYTLKLLNRHRVEIKEEFSYEKDIDLTWLRNLVFIVIIFAGLIVLYAIGVKLKGISFTQGDLLVFVFLVVVVYIISFLGYKQGHIFTYQLPAGGVKEIEKNKQPKQNAEKEKIEFVSKKDKAFIEQLQSLMEVQKPYLNNELTLYDLATLLNVPTSHLSWCLNSCLHTNFYQFVNKYRVKEFQQRISQNENKDFTLLTIAYNSGFNSKATFNRIFKEFTGKTPSEYQKSLNISA